MAEQIAPAPSAAGPARPEYPKARLVRYVAYRYGDQGANEPALVRVAGVARAPEKEQSK